MLQKALPGISGEHDLIRGLSKNGGIRYAENGVEGFGGDLFSGGIASCVEISDEGSGELWPNIDPAGVEFCRRCGVFSPRPLDVFRRKKIVERTYRKTIGPGWWLIASDSLFCFSSS